MGNVKRLREILDILACPACKGDIKISDDETHLICEGCGRQYEIRNGIPIMLLEDAKLAEVAKEEHKEEKD
ncbi:MAG: hypothetical protein RUDDFDWM_001751 [Candidatus Fervidibacterota bacterium]